MSLPRIVCLPGPSSEVSGSLKTCAACGFDKLFKQPDFNRNLGLWLVGIASVLTVLFAMTDQLWWVVWSPMPAFFFLDRFFSLKSDSALLCYKCEHIHRPTKDNIGITNHFEDFDLDLHDRIHYQDRIKAT
jgi:hypothetical protein